MTGHCACLYSMYVKPSTSSVQYTDTGHFLCLLVGVSPLRFPTRAFIKQVSVKRDACTVTYLAPEPKHPNSQDALRALLLDFSSRYKQCPLAYYFSWWLLDCIAGKWMSKYGSYILLIKSNMNNNTKKTDSSWLTNYLSLA